MQEQVGSEDEMDLAYLRKERKLKCLECCGHVESGLGTLRNLGRSLQDTRETENLILTDLGTLSRGSSQRIARSVFVKGEKKAMWISVNSHLLSHHVQT